MDYQHALNAWAERRHGLEPGTVSEAELTTATETGGGCDSCAYDYVVYELAFKITNTGRRVFEDSIEMPFADLLKEILEGTNA